MFQCMYKGDRLWSLDLLNEYKLYDLEKREEWALLSGKGELVCEVCGEKLYLKAGDHYRPHFAHRPNPNRVCFAEKIEESQKHAISRRDLLIHAEDNYPESQVATWRLVANKRPDVSVHRHHQVVLAIEYIRNNKSFHNITEKQHHYDEHQVPVIWVLDEEEFKGEHVDTLMANYLSKNALKMLYMYNPVSRVMTFIRLMTYITPDDKLFSIDIYKESHPLEECELSPIGYSISGFEKRFDEAYHQYSIRQHAKYELASVADPHKAGLLGMKNWIALSKGVREVESMKESYLFKFQNNSHVVHFIQNRVTIDMIDEMFAFEPDYKRIFEIGDPKRNEAILNIAPRDQLIFFYSARLARVDVYQYTTYKGQGAWVKANVSTRWIHLSPAGDYYGLFEDELAQAINKFQEAVDRNQLETVELKADEKDSTMLTTEKAYPCEECGVLTTEYAYKNPRTQTCICKECARRPKGR